MYVCECVYVYTKKICNSTTHKAISIILPHHSHTRNQHKKTLFIQTFMPSYNPNHTVSQI